MKERLQQRRNLMKRLVLLVLVAQCSVVASGMLRRRQKSSSLQTLSTDFPSLDVTMEMARLSKLVYLLKHCNSCRDANTTLTNGTVVPIVPSDLTCHLYYHATSGGTQVLVVSSTVKKYLAIVFAGTDNIRTTLTDGDILLKPFGPLDKDGKSKLLPFDYKTTARVHAGFDNAVFGYGLFDDVVQLVQHVLQQYPDYALYTTGHSLGGANALLTAVGISLTHPSWNVTCINFGCPRTGNREWRDFLHSLGSLGIWRFVLGWDLVPRLPELAFVHVGHTVQLNHHHEESITREGAEAYYLHYGNETLGYAGVPVGWSAKPFIWVPGALGSHSMTRYRLFFQNYSQVDPEKYYVSEFCPIDNTTIVDDDILPPGPPDDDCEREEIRDGLISTWLKHLI